MPKSTGVKEIREVDVHEDEELMTALTCSQCTETFAWVEQWAPTYCPICGTKNFETGEKPDDA